MAAYCSIPSAWISRQPTRTSFPTSATGSRTTASGPSTAASSAIASATYPACNWARRSPFGLEPYPQFGWSYHIPFFLGYGVSAGSGAKYVYKDADWHVQAGYFPRMLPGGVRYSPEVGRYADLDDNAVAAIHSRQDNEKRDQLNLRVARNLAGDGWKSELGASLAASRLYNATTRDDGRYWAAGLHGVLNAGNWTFSGEAIRYAFDPKNPAGVSDDVVLMGTNGLTPAYLMAARASVASFNVAYDVPTPNLGMLKKLRFYNDYSRMFRTRPAGTTRRCIPQGCSSSPCRSWAGWTSPGDATPIPTAVPRAARASAAPVRRAATSGYSAPT